MKNKELFDRANKDGDLELKKKLRYDYDKWCKKNGKDFFSAQSTIDWMDDEVDWNNQEVK